MKAQGLLSKDDQREIWKQWLNLVK